MITDPSKRLYVRSRPDWNHNNLGSWQPPDRNDPLSGSAPVGEWSFRVQGGPIKPCSNNREFRLLEILLHAGKDGIDQISLIEEFYGRDVRDGDHDEFRNKIGALISQLRRLIGDEDRQVIPRRSQNRVAIDFDQVSVDALEFRKRLDVFGDVAGSFFSSLGGRKRFFDVYSASNRDDRGAGWNPPNVFARESLAFETLERICLGDDRGLLTLHGKGSVGRVSLSKAIGALSFIHLGWIPLWLDLVGESAITGDAAPDIEDLLDHRLHSPDGRQWPSSRQVLLMINSTPARKDEVAGFVNRLRDPSRNYDVPANLKILVCSDEPLEVRGEARQEVRPLTVEESVDLLDRRYRYRSGTRPPSGLLKSFRTVVAHDGQEGFSPESVVSLAESAVEDGLMEITAENLEKARKPDLGQLARGAGGTGEALESSLNQLTVFDGPFTIEEAIAVCPEFQFWAGHPNIVEACLNPTSELDRYEIRLSNLDAQSVNLTPTTVDNLVTLVEERLKRADKHAEGAVLEVVRRRPEIRWLIDTDMPVPDPRRRRLLIELTEYWAATSRQAEGLEYLEPLLNTTEGEERVEILLSCSRLLLTRQRAEDLRQSMDLSREVADSKSASDPHRAQAMLNLGITFYWLGEADSADEALKEAMEIDPEFTSRSKTQMGWVELQRSQFTKAAGVFREAIESANKPSEEAHARQGLALSQQRVGDLMSAAEEYAQSMRLVSGEAGLRQICRSELGLIEIARLRGDFTTAMGLIEQRMFELEPPELAYLKARYLQQRARVHLSKGELGLASADEVASQEGFSGKGQGGIPWLRTYAEYLKGRIAERDGTPRSEVAELFRDSVDLAYEARQPWAVARAASVLAGVLAEMNELAQARNELRKAVSAHEEIGEICPDVLAKTLQASATYALGIDAERATCLELESSARRLGRVTRRSEIEDGFFEKTLKLIEELIEDEPPARTAPATESPGSGGGISPILGAVLAESRMGAADLASAEAIWVDGEDGPGRRLIEPPSVSARRVHSLSELNHLFGTHEDQGLLAWASGLLFLPTRPSSEPPLLPFAGRSRIDTRNGIAAWRLDSLQLEPAVRWLGESFPRQGVACWAFVGLGGGPARP